MKKIYTILFSVCMLTVAIQAQDFTPVYVQFLGNTGFLITSLDKKILIDAPFKVGSQWGLIVPTSETNSKIAGGSAQFSDLDMILISHEHQDHYDLSLLEDCIANNPDATVIVTPRLYEKAESGFTDFDALNDRMFAPELNWKESLDTTFHEIGLRISKIKHHLPDASDTWNFSFLFDINGYKILKNGASSISDYSGEYDALDYQNDSIDLAILHYFCLTNNIWTGSTTLSIDQTKVDMVKTHINPKEIVFDHVYNHSTAIDKINTLLESETGYPPVYIFSKSLETKLYTKGEIDYFGQTPPGDSAVVFAPGFFSLEDRYEYGQFFAPDGKTFYFGVTNSTWSDCKLWASKYSNGNWMQATPVDILQSMDVWVPTVNPKGNTLYFSSGYLSFPKANLWKCNIINDSVQHPIKLDLPINSDESEWRACEGGSNTVIFSSNRSGGNGNQDLYYSKLVNDSFTAPVNFGKPVNGSANDGSPYLAADESYIIFESQRSGGFGKTDLYISFKKDNELWTNPKNMGSKINSSWFEDQPSVTPDGKYLIFCKREASTTSIPTHIYWVSSSIIDSLKNTNYTPYLKNDIPNDTFFIEKENSYTIPDTIFVDDDGNHTLTYTAKLYNGNDLPTWLSFDVQTKTFSGTPSETGKLNIRITATDTAGASVSDIFRLFLEENTGINKNIDIPNLIVYPNPAQDLIHIKNYTPDQIDGFIIMDVSGKSIKQGELHSNTIDVSEMGKGVYILKLEWGNKPVFQKVIIE